MTTSLELLRTLRQSLPDFGPRCLKVRDKSGNIVPLAFNAAQRIAHAALEKQRAEHGWVRALFLKGRQQGISTYTAGRFYHRASMNRGVNVFILAHEQAASDNLYGMAERFQRHNPLAPHVGVSNIKEMVFDRLESTYSVGTAGAKAGGRSRTMTLFHGSEVAFWPNAAEHFAASVQAVPLLTGTEIILESTSNGTGGEFYERWQDAERGNGDFIPIFIPWFLQLEYARPAAPDFELSADADEGEMSEVEYAEAFDLTLEQMAWRRSKIAELRSVQRFQREYPSTPAEAWTASPDHEPFIAPLLVLRARKRQTKGIGPLVIGVDPAGMGGDRFSAAARRGLAVEWVKFRTKLDSTEGALWIKKLIDDHNAARVNVDLGNMGFEIVSKVKAFGPRYAEIVRGVNFGATSQHKKATPEVPGPANRRAEMWMRIRDWLLLEEGVSLPDMDALQTDLTAPRQKTRLSNDFLLESKEQMKARGVRSPDLGDAVGLTFASNTDYLREPETQRKVSAFGSPDTASQRSTPLPPMPTGGGSWMI